MDRLSLLFSYPPDNLLIYGQYNPWLVLLSVFVAVFTASMGLYMACEAGSTLNRPRRLLTLLTGSVALGGGVWAMHFIGMLAFDLCTPVEQALAYIREQSGRHFDPRLVELLDKELDKILAVKEQWAE